MLLNNYSIKEEIRDQEYIATNEDDNTTYPDLRNEGKVILRRKFTALEDYLIGQEKSLVNDLTFLF